MNHLLTLGAAILAFVVNFVAWYMAGRRTLYVLRLDIIKTMHLVWWEDLLPYINIGGFLLVPSVIEKAIVALSGATGGAIGIGLAMLIEKKRKKKDLGGKL